MTALKARIAEVIRTSADKDGIEVDHVAAGRALVWIEVYEPAEPPGRVERIVARRKVKVNLTHERPEHIKTQIEAFRRKVELAYERAEVLDGMIGREFGR
jgi:hypothetical protein